MKWKKRNGWKKATTKESKNTHKQTDILAAGGQANSQGDNLSFFLSRTLCKWDVSNLVHHKDNLCLLHHIYLYQSS